MPPTLKDYAKYSQLATRVLLSTNNALNLRVPRKYEQFEWKHGDTEEI
jgi:hypothetical protein